MTGKIAQKLMLLLVFYGSPLAKASLSTHSLNLEATTRTCESILNALSTPSPDLGSNFSNPYHVPAVFNDTYVVAREESSLPGTGSMINHIVIKNKLTGETVVDDSVLRLAVDSFFKASGNIGRSSIKYESIAFSVYQPQIFFMAESKAKTHGAFVYNFKTRALTSLFVEPTPRSYYDFSISLSNNERFVIVSSPLVANQRQSHSIVDLKENRILNVLSPTRKGNTAWKFKISDDGTRIINFGGEHENWKWTHYNHVARLPSTWPSHSSSYSSSEIPIEELDSYKIFKGKILAQDSSLQRFLIDKTHFNTKHSAVDDLTYMLPRLAIANLNDKNTAKFQTLSGWDGILESIKAVAKSGIYIRYDNISAQMTPDGRYLSLDANFSNVASITNAEERTSLHHEFQHNLIVHWDMNSAADPKTYSSEFFDKNKDTEPGIGKTAEFSPSRWWSRQFTSKLLDNGQLIFARAIEHNDKKTSTIYVNVATSDLATSDLPMVASTALPDIDFSTDPRSGIVDFKISPKGHFLEVRLSSNGIYYVPIKAPGVP